MSKIYREFKKADVTLFNGDNSYEYYFIDGEEVTIVSATEEGSLSVTNWKDAGEAMANLLRDSNNWQIIDSTSDGDGFLEMYVFRHNRKLLRHR